MYRKTCLVQVSRVYRLLHNYYDYDNKTMDPSTLFIVAMVFGVFAIAFIIALVGGLVYQYAQIQELQRQMRDSQLERNDVQTELTRQQRQINQFASDLSNTTTLTGPQGPAGKNANQLIAQGVPVWMYSTVRSTSGDILLDAAGLMTESYQVVGSPGADVNLTLPSGAELDAAVLATGTPLSIGMSRYFYIDNSSDQGVQFVESVSGGITLSLINGVLQASNTATMYMLIRVGVNAWEIIRVS